MSFVKLDCGMLDSSIWPDFIQKNVFITALLMAVPRVFNEPQKQLEVESLNETGFEVPPGWYGFVQASGDGILRRALIPCDANEGMAALVRLGSADPLSRSQDFEGRRMVRVSGGYILLNYMDYRERDHTAAIRQRRYRARLREEPNQEKVDFLASLKGDPAYAGVDVGAELDKMDVWLLAHPGRRKTQQFAISWLNRVEKSIPLIDPGNGGVVAQKCPNCGYEGHAKRSDGKCVKCSS